jgi:TonB family protein
MRRIHVASALLFPLLCTAAAVASSPATDATASTSVPQVSTGVISPAIVYSTDVALPSDGTVERFPNDARVVLHLNVDQAGKVQDVQVVKSLYPELNSHVVDAVRQFRFRPARLDNQTVPVDMLLTVDVKH